MTTDVNKNVTNGVRPGLRLRKARETLNLSLDDVARHLKSNKKIIEALEKEDTLNLPQPIYVSGYLRSYANLVSLPAGDILEAYPNLSMADPVLPKFKSTTASSAKFGGTGILAKKKFNFNSIFIASILVAIVGVGGWFYTQIYSQNYFQSNAQNGSLSGGATSPTADIVSGTKLQDSDLDVHAPDLQTQIQEEIEQELRQEKQKSTATVAKVLSVTSRILLEFTEDSWVEVADATGEKLLYRLVKAPARRVVQGQAPFKVFLGYAPGVSINYNGLPFDFASNMDGDVAQFSIGKVGDNLQKKN